MPTNRLKRGPRVLAPQRVGPWTGVRKSADPFEENATVLYDASNVYGIDTPNGSGWSQRPPFTTVQVGGALGGISGGLLTSEASVTIDTEAGVDITLDGPAAPSNGTVGQCVFDHTRIDGTVDRLLVINGHLYRWDGVTSFTDVTPLTVTIDASARVFCCTFADRVIVTDGVNRPWIFNPADLTGTLIQYNAASDLWCAFGPPVVYGAKVFFIIQSIAGVVTRSTITWSEENSPSTGYVQTNFDNTWSLTQTRSDPLTCLVATNVALYYFRARSIGAITGTVNSTFQSSATLDAISSAIGTTTPASVVLTGSHIWFVDEQGRPHRFAVGSSTIEELWLQARDDITAALNKTGAVAAIVTLGMACYQPDTRHVLFAVYLPSGLGLARPQSLLVFKADTGSYQGTWTNGAGLSRVMLDALGPMRDSAGRYSILVLGQTNTIDPTTRGAVIRQRTTYEVSSTAGLTWTDDSGAITSSIVTGQVGGNEADAERIFDKVSARVLPPVGVDALRTFTIQTTTPRGGQTARLSAIAPAPFLAGDDGHVTWGLYQRGRWARFSVETSANTSPSPVVFDSLTVTAVLDAADPEIP